MRSWQGSSDGELFWVSGLPDLVGGSPGVCAVLGPLHLSSLWHDAHPCVFCDCGGRAPLALGKARPQAPPHLLLPPCSRVLAHVQLGVSSVWLYHPFP